MYSIVDGDPNTQFRLADPEKGEIVISSSLDAEKQASYNVRSCVTIVTFGIIFSFYFS